MLINDNIKLLTLFHYTYMIIIVSPINIDKQSKQGGVFNESEVKFSCA